EQAASRLARRSGVGAAYRRHGPTASGSGESRVSVLRRTPNAAADCGGRRSAHQPALRGVGRGSAVAGSERGRADGKAVAVTYRAVMTWRSATVVLCSPALPDFLPAAALGVVRAAETVYAAAGLPDSLRVTLDAKPAPHPEELTKQSGVVLVAPAAHEPGATALIEAGATVIEAPAPPLVRAVEVMDRLRSPGGCPWDGAQTHDSLRRYLIEETYELLEAIEEQDRSAMREELGDVLLQVLFHARVAAEHESDAFDIDDVAKHLVDKMVGRHQYLFAGADRVDSADQQQVRWEELKQRE